MEAVSGGDGGGGGWGRGNVWLEGQSGGFEVGLYD